MQLFKDNPFLKQKKELSNYFMISVPWNPDFSFLYDMDDLPRSSNFLATQRRWHLQGNFSAQKNALLLPLPISSNLSSPLPKESVSI
jgi:hypothetical protein